MDKDHLAGHASINSWLIQITVMANLSFEQVLAETVALAERAGEDHPEIWAEQIIENWLDWLDTDKPKIADALRRRWNTDELV